MKQFFVWTKVFSAPVAILGALLSYYVWTFVAGQPVPLDLIGPILWGYPVLDWLITGVGGCFAALAFVYAVSEKRTWTNWLYGIPLSFINVLMVYTWWSMEKGNTDVVLASILLSVGMIANVCAAGIYLFRPFHLPAIEA